jgi:hypothetical protein
MPGPLTPDSPEQDAPQPDPPTPDSPGTLATPEGDNEYATDQPLSPDAPAATRPRGNEPHPSMPLRPALDPNT